MKIALVGNPNSGKTTLFNALTGGNQYVGNWPGVTVGATIGRSRKDKSVQYIDLPGIYSLSPYSPEEILTRNFLENERPNLILNIIDGTNLERNLYLTTQVLELGIPTIIALNMMDIVEKRGAKIDIEKLKIHLGCEIIPISANKNDNLETLISACKSQQTRRGDHWSPATVGARHGEPVDEESAISERYDYIVSIVKDCYIKGKKSSNKIDAILTNRILAIPIFALVMFAVYYISISSVGKLATDWANNSLFGARGISFYITILLEQMGSASWLTALICDGIIAGVGAVLAFVPGLFILFFLLSFLESCGYIARIAFIMDKIFRHFGLSGKSIIPLLIGTGCGVPGIMASRTIENQSDRRITIITTTFIPCSAKLPIIALIAGAVFGGVWWVAPSAYFLGIAAILTSGIVLKKMRGMKSANTPFIMELPNYHLPALRDLLYSASERCFSFIKKAGTVILLGAIFIWLSSNLNWKMQFTEMHESILADIGRSIAWIFAPLGWGEWRMAVATLTGLIAKENLVSTLGILNSVGGDAHIAPLAPIFNYASGYSFLVFNLLCAPCIAAIAAMAREMHSPKWTWFALGYQTAFAYLAAFLVYNIANLILFL